MSSRNWYRSASDSEREAHRERMRTIIAAKQADSLKYVTKHGTWTEEEDLFICNNRHLGLTELARRLQRTYGATSRRSALLLRKETGETREYNKLEQCPVATLCACATQDDEHEDWCPTLTTPDEGGL